jgi:predicted AlkP superfamily pyrophosphatase or phosphodiesterase
MRKISLRNIKIAFSIFFVFFIFFSCSTSALPSRKTAHSTVFFPAGHLIFIGFDGWGSYYLKTANMPVIKRMILNGTSGTDVFSVIPSNSWPNWTSLFTGNPPEKQAENNFKSFFSIVKDSFSIRQLDPEDNPVVLFYEWEDLYNICPDNAAIKLKISSDYASVYKITSYIISKKPVFTAIIFDEPDTTGHTSGWGSKAYFDKLALLDNFVAVIEQAVKDSGIYDNTVFIFSSDHGGSFKGHGPKTSRHRKIPLVFYGMGIKKGYNIPFPLDIYDIAPTMAAILGLQTPQSWTGKAIFEIFN